MAIAVYQTEIKLAFGVELVDAGDVELAVGFCEVEKPGTAGEDAP